MSDIFKLVGSIVIKNEEANKAIDDTKGKAEGLKGALDGSGTSADNLSGKIGEKSKFGTAAVFMGTMLSNMATYAASLATNLAKAGIGFASEMEQNIGGVETLFGDAAGTVFANADNAYKTAGMSANEYMQTITGFAAALKQSVASEEEVARVADMAIIDMSDNANKMGSDMTSIQNAYQGFAKQNFTMLDNLKLGYGGTKEEMERLLVDAGKLAGQQYDISNLADIFEAIHVIQTEMGIAGTTAQEAGTTLAGSAASAKSAWENFLSDTMMTAIPKLTEVINKIMTWVEQNPESVQKFADALSNFASASFDALLGAFEWMTNNSELIKAAIMGIATAMTIAAVAAHPYAAAVTAVVAALALMTARNADGDAYNHFFDGYTDEDLATLQAYVDAVNRYREAEAALARDESNQTLIDNFIAAGNAMEEASEKASAIDGLIAAYNAWRSGQAENVGGDMYLDVPLRVSDDSQSSMQSEIDGYDMEGVVKMLADTSGLQAAVSATGLTAYVNLQPIGPVTDGQTQVDGSHASGLERVPRDNYIARLHKDEAVLTSTQAAAWRSGSMGGDVGRLEAAINNLGTMLQQVVANTAGGKQVVLDSGVLVGQLAPAMDAQLGAISGRKGRRA